MFTEKKEKCLFSCLSDDTDYMVVILDRSFHCKGVKKKFRDSVGTRAQVIGKMKKKRKTFYQTIFISSGFSFSPEYEHSDKIKRKQNHMRTGRTTTCRKQNLPYMFLHQNTKTVKLLVQFHMLSNLWLVFVPKSLNTTQQQKKKINVNKQHRTKQKKKIFPLSAVQLVDLKCTRND